MSKAEAVKSKRLAFLEAWFRNHYEAKTWRHPEFLKAIEEYCLISYGVSDSAARNMAKIVQLRLIKTKPALLVQPTIDVPESGLSITEMISGYRQANPAEFKAPTTEWAVSEEEIIETAESENELPQEGSE